jgi:hypothetical protein
MAEQNLADVQQQVFADDFDGNFDSGDNGGEFEGGADGQPGPGMGQSKSSRRRRRKRKNKVAVPGGEGAAATTTGEGAAPATIVMEGESLALAGAPATSFAAAAQPQQRKPQPQQTNGAQPQGQGKRWKKKFRDRERRPRTDNPGNEARADNGSNGNGGGGYNGGGYSRGGRPDNFGNLVNGSFKRKTKGQQKERGFVGPMDHSYRAEGSEFGEAPPSTISLNGSHGRRNGHRHHGDSQPIDHSMPRPVPIPENAQTHIYFFIEELFFIAKIQEVARKQGVKVAFVKNDKDALAELTSGSEENHPALIVFDLNNANAKPLTTIPKLKAKLKRGTSIVGFLSHLQGDLKAKAMEAGCDVVMPRAAFSQNLPNLLRRYGVEEEDEVNYNY